MGRKAGFKHSEETKLKMSKSRMGRKTWNKGIKGDKSHNWKGGFYVNASGYKLVLMPEYHRADSKGYVYEHIVVMEKKLGRKLISPENVHHINGDKSDNRPENLQLFSSKSEHTKEHYPGSKFQSLNIQRQTSHLK